MLELLSDQVNFNTVLTATKQRIDLLSSGNLRFYCNLRETGEFKADQVLLQNLLLALAENAMLFVDKSKPENCFSVKIESGNLSTRIMAADNGKGEMPAGRNDPSSLFYNTISTLVNDLNGSINIDASPGIGTAIEIIVPSAGSQLP